MQTEETYREAHRRSHKLLSAYLALWAWQRGADCVAIRRGDLLSCLSLQRMKNKRVDWLKEDLAHLFPHATCSRATGSRMYATLYLSRVPLPSSFLTGQSLTSRISLLREAGVRAEIVELPAEAEMVRMMASVIHGLTDFPDSPLMPIKKAKKQVRTTPRKGLFD